MTINVFIPTLTLCSMYVCGVLRLKLQRRPIYKNLKIIYYESN